MAEATTIARPYARAAFETASGEEGGLAAWSDMLQLAAVIAQDDAMHGMLTNPEYSDDFKAGFFLELCSEKLSSSGSNFIKVLADNQRLDIIPEIAQVYEELRAEAEKTLEAEMVSAFEVSEQQRESIAAALSKRLDREVALHCSVDSSLIGGAIIRAGDLVIDGSARGKLARLSNQLSQ